MVMDHSQDRPSMEEITASGISLSERELEQLLMKDEDFVPFSWARLKETIGIVKIAFSDIASEN